MEELTREGHVECQVQTSWKIRTWWATLNDHEKKRRTKRCDEHSKGLRRKRKRKMWWITTSNQEMKNTWWVIALQSKKKRTWRVVEKDQKERKGKEECGE